MDAILVRFGHREYTITATADRFGVKRGTEGEFKYLPVLWDVYAHERPRPYRTRLKFSGTAEDLLEYMVVVANLRVRSDWGLCVDTCEQVLATGRTPRYNRKEA